MNTKKDFDTKIQSHDDLCLQYLRNHGGSAQLCEVRFRIGIIQRLINRKLVKVTNKGTGFYLELDEV